MLKLLYTEMMQPKCVFIVSLMPLMRVIYMVQS